jgi:hypothetical protein
MENERFKKWAVCGRRGLSDETKPRRSWHTSQPPGLRGWAKRVVTFEVAVEQGALGRDLELVDPTIDHRRPSSETGPERLWKGTTITNPRFSALIMQRAASNATRVCGDHETTRLQDATSSASLSTAHHLKWQ